VLSLSLASYDRLLGLGYCGAHHLCRVAGLIPYGRLCSVAVSWVFHEKLYCLSLSKTDLKWLTHFLLLMSWCFYVAAVWLKVQLWKVSLQSRRKSFLLQRLQPMAKNHRWVSEYMCVCVDQTWNTTYTKMTQSGLLSHLFAVKH